MFYAPTPTGMEKYRNKISVDLPAFERLVNRKEIELIHYEDYGNLDFYNSELVNIIYNSFKELYPLYEYLNTIG